MVKKGFHEIQIQIQLHLRLRCRGLRLRRRILHRFITRFHYMVIQLLHHLLLGFLGLGSSVGCFRLDVGVRLRLRLPCALHTVRAPCALRTVRAPCSLRAATHHSPLCVPPCCNPSCPPVCPWHPQCPPQHEEPGDNRREENEHEDSSSGEDSKE